MFISNVNVKYAYCLQLTRTSRILQVERFQSGHQEGIGEEQREESPDKEKQEASYGIKTKWKLQI